MGRGRGERFCFIGAFVSHPERVRLNKERLNRSDDPKVGQSILVLRETPATSDPTSSSSSSSSSSFCTSYSALPPPDNPN